MARASNNWVSLGPLKGQNSSDNPLTLGEGWATDTLNLVMDPLSSVAVKRRGSTALPMPNGTYNLARHVPLGSAVHDDELWAFGRAPLGSPEGPSLAWRKVGGGAFVQMTGFPTEITVLRPVSFNGKLFLAGYDFSHNRMLVWDGVRFRYAGFRAPQVAPTAADFGTGTYANVPRYYRVDWIYVHPSTSATQARSELSPAVEFTPSGTGAGVRVTRAVGMPSEDAHATHWRVWGSTAVNGVYFKLSGNIPFATTTFDDVVLPAAYAGEVAQEVGTFLPLPGALRLITDGHRLLMAGRGSSYTTDFPGWTQPRSNRVWYTPVLGTLDQGDDERIPYTSSQRNFLDVGDPPTGDIIELAGPMEGEIFAFAKHRTWRLIPTGDVTTPYLTNPVTMVFGAGETPHAIQSSTALGETESGQPAVYFFDESAGLYRVTAGENIQFVSADIQTEIMAMRPRLKEGMTLFSWPERKQTWWVLPLQNPIENRIYVFQWEAGRSNAQRVGGGWTKWVHVSRFLTFLLHNQTPGLDTPAGEAKVPYGCPAGGTNPIGYVFDRDEAIDGDVPYSASVTCAPLLPSEAHDQIRVAPPTLITTPHKATRLTVSSIRDFGTETRSTEIWIAPEGNETAVVRTAEGLYQGDCTAIQIRIADAEPNPALWQIHIATMPVIRQQGR